MTPALSIPDPPGERRWRRLALVLASAGLVVAGLLGWCG